MQLARGLIWSLVIHLLTWYLNTFFYREDMYAQDSIDLLNRAGIQFKRHEEEGIDVGDFAELLITSGLVLNEDVKWLSFHRYSLNCYFFVKLHYNLALSQTLKGNRRFLQ